MYSLWSITDIAFHKIIYTGKWQRINNGKFTAHDPAFSIILVPVLHKRKFTSVFIPYFLSINYIYASRKIIIHKKYKNDPEMYSSGDYNCVLIND